MDSLLSFLYGAALIAVVVGIFNIIIFVHELGHFLAARWRGLQIDRFQIWFGKPIWKKEINGVQYGLGWIPAGGFVALPQMAPMESIEGSNREEGHEAAPLPPIKPLDKIIVAFAGPLFSFMLALLAGLAVWGIGRPKDFVESTTIGYVAPDGAAAGQLQVGDRILAVNGKPVDGFTGSPKLNSIDESIMLSEGQEIEFLVDRPGEGEVKVSCGFAIPDNKWWQRKGMRQVGIGVETRTLIGKPSEGSPAAQAGLQEGDEIVEVDGEKLFSRLRFQDIVEASEGRELSFTVRRGDELIRDIAVTPQIPKNANLPESLNRYMIGVHFTPRPEWNQTDYNPDPFTQVGDSLRMMWVTITSIASKDTSVGIQHLSGPVGIGGAMLDLLRTPDGWKRLLWFMVLFNVNLAVLNMMPFPVLDGGHIVLAFGEMVAGRPVRARLLEVVQGVFVLLLLSLFLFITTKDIGDRLGFGGGGGPEKLEWSQGSGG